MNTIYRHLKKFIFCLAVGLAATVASLPAVFHLLFPEKSLEGRSLLIRVGFFCALALIYSAILWTGLLGARWVSASFPRWEAGLARWNRQRWAAWIGWAAILLAGLALLVVNIRIVAFPYQMEYREGAIVLTTQAFLKGINPWALQNNPVYINVYGFVYNFVVLPFALIFGNLIWVHRMISFLGILGQMAILGLVMHKRGIEKIWIAAAALFLWLGQIFYTTPLARPDTLGQLFFLLTIFLPILEDYSPRSLIWSAVCGLLGFFTKPYYILGLPFVACYSFLFVSKKKAVIYAGAALGVLAGAVLLVNRVWEAYFLNVVYSHIADTNSIFCYMVQQTGKFLRDYWALLILCLLPFAGWLLGDTGDLRRLQPDLKHADTGFFQASVDPNLLYLLISAALIFFSLGRHNGTIQAYYYQLLTPFLVILVFEAIQKRAWLRNFAILLVAVNLLSQGAENLKPDFTPYDTSAWQKLSTYLDQSKRVLNPPETSYELIRRGIPVENSGQTDYFFPIPATPTPFYPNLSAIHQTADNFNRNEQKMLEQKQFDLYLADDYNHAYLKNEQIAHNYQKIDTITLDMPHVNQKWVMDIMTPTSEN